jgi:hypothetical protein
MSIKTYISVFIILCSLASYGQESTQIIKGKVVDEITQMPIPAASVVLINSKPLHGTSTDFNGNFAISNVPFGRHNIQISSIGYEPVIVSNILVSSAKEVTLQISLKETSAILDEVVIAPKIHKEKPLNKTALVSAKMLSVEEANRYAGGFDDPARLASSFAGVASNVGNNAIIIRGNAPKFIQWKMEGIEIPNPNHFADLGTFGGGGLTALSSNLLANSDFFTGAFPSEYNNAISGVFDMKMRKGNNSKHEHSAELGLIGIDFASEGPLNKSKNSSYLVNYRYSTLGLVSSLLPEDAQGTNYQDLAFKLNFYTKKAGSFSFWGLGLIDNSGTTAKKDTSLWEYKKDGQNEKAKQFMGATGINHRYFFKNNAYINSTIAISASGLKFKTDKLDTNLVATPENEIKNTNYNITFKTILNKKFSNSHTNRTGFSAVGMHYDLLLKETKNSNQLETIVSKNGFSTLLSGFTNSTFNFNKLTINAGVNAQLFTLNNSRTIEPRLGLSYELNSKNKLSFAYGLHSRIEQLHTYFVKDPITNKAPNKELDFTKAHHFVLGYDWNINNKLHLKIEPYYQFLYDIPYIKNSTSSLLNVAKDWFENNAYINGGKGRNYGIDFTLEKYIDNGLYYLFTASVFNSEYKTDTNTWYNTRFNRSYLANFLIGKEYVVGKRNQNLLSINLRFSYQGGDRFSSIDNAKSNLTQEVVYNETSPFTQKADASFVSHITVNYQWNKKKTTQKLSLKIINATNYEEFLGHRYNIKKQEVDLYKEALLIPNLSYKVSF